MDTGSIIRARKQAEQTVVDMEDGPLKTKAFEVIFEKLLDQERPPASPPAHDESDSGAAESISTGQEQGIPDSCPDRILSLRREGFFGTGKSLGEIRNELQVHGWIYPVTSLSGPLQRLVQRRELRRIVSQVGKKGSYTYVAP
jgi:hypothetical protein